MRKTHAMNPFHKIERWTGRHYRAAELWEVGAYILVRHRTGTSICRKLKIQMDLLEDVEVRNDLAEQNQLNSMAPDAGDADVPMQDATEMEADDDMFDPEAEAREYAAIDQIIEELHANNAAAGDEPTQCPLGIDADDELVAGEVEADIPIQTSGPGRKAKIPTTDALQNAYMRVVHTNGLHHLAVVGCPCQAEGSDGILAYDLMASRLFPASFHRIRTLFTCQMLDYFRLCNLELKASAYQFNQLLRRITMPMAPSQVANIYHEFRRMTRIWRWLKRLKWNGFCHNARDPMEVKGGELAIYCPACPQPGINIPDGWKEDINKFLYRRVFVADGNFKADHVRQERTKVDHWLSEGGGMDPRFEDYDTFLASAKERPTVSRHIIWKCRSRCIHN